MPGTGLIAWAMDYKVDRGRKDVTVTLLGGGQSRAVYRQGLGCILAAWRGGCRCIAARSAASDAAARAAARNCRAFAGRARQSGTRPALDRAFAEPAQPPFRHTEAVVVLKDGRVVAERYAPGFGIDTPILGYSATKSVISALIGILVRQGKLAVDDRRRSRRGRIRMIPTMPSRSTICSGTPAVWRWAVRSMPRSPAPSRRSTR